MGNKDGHILFIDRTQDVQYVVIMYTAHSTVNSVQGTALHVQCAGKSEECADYIEKFIRT